MAKNEVSANSALVEFPRDEWGFTSELRAAGLRAASSVRGNKEKHELFVATLRVLAQHAAARFNSDGRDIAIYGAEIAAREASEYRRVACHGIASDDTKAVAE